MAEIISIHIVRKQNDPTESCNQVMVRTNFGIEGDYRSGKYQIGQITLVESEIMDTVSRELGYNIPAGASRRQIMVGDSRVDAEAGRNAGLPVIAVNYGYSSEPVESLEADCLIDDFGQLPQAITQLCLMQGG